MILLVVGIALLFLVVPAAISLGVGKAARLRDRRG